VRESLFVMAALTFGYYAGYSWRTYNEPEPHHDFLAQLCAPAWFCLLVIAGLLV